MKTFATAFKEVYGEALKEYGFKKVKGKYPYYARVIGDEIVHVITYIGEWCPEYDKKAFSILGGIATVYRGRISFDISPKDNSEWFVKNSEISNKLYGNNEKEERFWRVNKYLYEANNEDDMVERLKIAVEDTKLYILKEMEKTKDLDSCIKFLKIFRPNLLMVRANEKYIKMGGKVYNEGLMCVKNYGNNYYYKYVEDMQDIFREYDVREYRWIITGMSGLTMEEHKQNIEERKNQLKELLSDYRCMVQIESWKEMIKIELEQRKKNNLELLKKCELL